MSAFEKFNIETRPCECEQHGTFESRRLLGTVWSRCPECERTRTEALKAERAESERVERRARWERKLGESGIPPRFMDRRLARFVADTADKRRALDFAQAYAKTFGEDAGISGRSAVFIGKPGTGKTHLAVGIGLEIMDSGYSALFCTVMRALRRVKDTWERGSRETQSEAISALTTPDLLILDEVGIQFGTKAERDILFDVLNERYERRKPAIYLSNLLLDEVQSFLGERIFDRMREDGGDVIPFNWDSHRGAA